MVVKRAFCVLIGTALLGGCGDKAQPSADDRAPQALASSGNGELSSSGVRKPVGVDGPSVAPGTGGAGLTPGSADPIIARIDGEPMTREQLIKPLIESRGLTMLLNLVQLELVKQDAVKAGVKVTDQDVAEERKFTLDRLFAGTDVESKLQGKLDDALIQHKDAEAAKIRAEIDSDRETLLRQYLDNQHITPAEYDILIQINAYLRRIALPQVKGKISDEAVRNAFGQMYGELVKVRYIELRNMEEVNKAKIRLAAGEKFEDVAKDMSINRLSAEQGGELPPFSAQSQQIPQNFKDVAFSLKPGETSDVVAYEASYLLIKQIEKIAPRAVKFEDVKESVRRTLDEKLLQTAMKKLREDLANQALGKTKAGNPILVIEDPLLRHQFEAKQAEQTRQRDQIQEEMNKEQRLRDSMRGAATRPATAQGTPPATGAAPEAATAPAGERPPATRPGTVTLPTLTPEEPATQVQPGK
jgi:parvulin-like peptidyl-prolyl isomerase